MRREDFQREACFCPECEQAGVSDKPQLRDPQSGKYLHGYALKRVYEASDKVLAQVRMLRQGPARAGRGRRPA